MRCLAVAPEARRNGSSGLEIAELALRTIKSIAAIVKTKNYKIFVFQEVEKMGPKH